MPATRRVAGAQVQRVPKWKVCRMAGQWLNVEEAVAYLSLPSPKALYERVRRGQVPAHRLGRNLRFNLSELDVMLATGRNPLSLAVGSLLRRPSAKKGGK